MKTLSTIVDWTLYFIGVIVISFLLIGTFVGFSANVHLGKPDENPPKELVSKTDSLKAVVADLEAKVEILNKYLVQKHLEYIDACDLKTKAK